LTAEPVKLQKVSAGVASGPFLIKEDFEQGTGDWSNRDGDVGATVTLDKTATFDRTQALKITNSNGDGNFAVNVGVPTFDSREYPVVQFDYRIRPGVKTNFLVKVNGRWYEIGFTDDPKELHDKRVNIAHIGDIEGVVSDDQWHTARFNLYDMLRTKTGNALIEAIVMADWDVGGYMKLQFGNNPKGSTYFIDNFSIRRDTYAGLRLEEETIVVDHFNQKKVTNALGGTTATFEGANGGSARATFSDEGATGKGNALQLSYEVSQTGGYAGYISNLQNLDLRGYQLLTFLIKSEAGGTDFLVGLKDTMEHENKVGISRYLSRPITGDWQKVEIPLAAFLDLDWGKIENLSLSFEKNLHEKGTIFVDEIEIHKEMKSFVVDNFERNDKRNFIGREQTTFASGATAINGQYTKGSPNGIYRISYGGNIGALNAYASDSKSFAGWETELGGIDCSQCGALSFRIRGAEGGENATIYLDDGNFRWGVELAKYAHVTASWESITIPLNEFGEYGVDLTHLSELQFVFEGAKMSGTIYLDDIQFGITDH